MVLRVGDNAVIFVPAGVSLEFIQRKHLRKLRCLEIYALEVAHGRRAGHVKLAADLFRRHQLFEGSDDSSNAPVGDALIAAYEGVLLKEALAALTAIAALAQMQEGFSAQWDISLMVCIR